MSRILKTVALLIALLAIIFFLYSYIAIPREISGDNAGKYNIGETVLFMSYDVYSLIQTIHKGDVITFNKSDMNMEGVAVVEFLPGQETKMDIYYFSDEIMGNQVLDGFVAIKFDQSSFLRAVPEEDVLGVAWFSF